MNTIDELEHQYNQKRAELHELSSQILKHLHDVFDSKLNTYKSFDDFLDDINNYAGDSFGKLMYINNVKNRYNPYPFNL